MKRKPLLRGLAGSLGCLLLLYTWQAIQIVRIGSAASTQAQASSTLVLMGKRMALGQVDVDFQQRLGRILEARRRQPRQSIILSGGGRISEAVVAEQWLLNRGVKGDLLLDTRSLNTAENLANSRQLAKPGSRLAIVSSRYHLARVGRLARESRMVVELVAAEDTMDWSMIQAWAVAREAVYLSALTLQGR